MLTKKVIRKMFVTSSIVVIILMIYLMPGVMELNNDIKTSFEYVEMSSNVIYLADNSGLLVETTVSLEANNSNEEKIKEIVKHLGDASNEIMPNGLNSVIDKDIKLIDVKVDENIAFLNFSRELIKGTDREIGRMIEAISYSVLNLKDINGVSFYVDGTNISELVTFNVPDIITTEYGINKKVHINKTDDIMSYVIYYLENIDNSNYLVPITKYINSNDEKINVIIEDLSSSYIYQPNLISIANEKLELINYEISNDEMILNFNNSIFLDKGEIVEEVIYPVVNTFFDNYDVKTIIIKVNGEEIFKKSLV